MKSTVTQRGQTAIPAAIRKRYHIVAHTRIEWIDDGHGISIVPIPADPIKALRGKFRDSNVAHALAVCRKEA
jgi:bifunctional DNA-binding transcriptional regulator/antitoxin component of YhaV-PrlF toxin-antitoxin module